MQIDKQLKNIIESKLKKSTGNDICINDSSPIHGGDTHPTFRLETNKGAFVLKTAKDIPSDLFEKEFNGLELLLKQKAIGVAKPLFYGKEGSRCFLAMKYIAKASADSDFWERFAKGLSRLHRCTQSAFGLETPNYIGALSQPNNSHDNWPDFYVSQRLQPLIRKCIDKKLLEKNFEDKAMLLYKHITDVFPDEPPALLHGDLWGGNYLCGPGGKPYLFDPAVYYGHREMDLAMTRLFGGFDRRFYWHYDEYFPLSPGWQKRIPLCQLYPLLVHSLLFGGGYIQQVRRILEEYGR